MDFSRPVVVTARPYYQSELTVYMANPELVTEFIQQNADNSERSGVFNIMWHFAEQKFQGVLDSMFAFDLAGVVRNVADYFKAIGWAFRYHLIYTVIFSVIKLALICIAGGAICRLAALQFARGEKPGLTEAMHYGFKRFIALFTAQLIPIAIIAFIGVLIFILGLITNIPWTGELIMAVSLPLALLGGALIALVAIGLLAGFNLMPPAIAYDGSDAFDAISRSFSYIYAKPWAFGFYSVLAAVYGAVCYMFVRFFAFLILFSSHKFLQLGVFTQAGSESGNKLNALWPEPDFMNLLTNPSRLTPNTWSQSVGAFLIYLCVLFIVGLVISFIISFYFSANTIIYSLLRKRVDNTALDDVYSQINPSDNEPFQAPKDQTPPKSQPVRQTRQHDKEFEENNQTTDNS
jgi:hypothetical protein